jgi:hypothetical protein
MSAVGSTDPRAGALSEALLLLQGRGMILDVARAVSTWLREEGIDGRIVGGLAVVLHGYVRTTLDVEIHTKEPDRVADVLVRHGATLDAQRREFLLDGIPVHLVLPEQTGPLRHPDEEIDGIRTVALGDLITLKLRSGTRSVRRTRDLADAIELIQRLMLTKTFASRLGKD